MIGHMAKMGEILPVNRGLYQAMVDSWAQWPNSHDLTQMLGPWMDKVYSSQVSPMIHQIFWVFSWVWISRTSKYGILGPNNNVEISEESFSGQLLENSSVTQMDGVSHGALGNL